MLVLSRRQNEAILFPTLGIQVDVIRAGGKVVRLGIQAPEDVRVLRAELAEHATTPTKPASTENDAREFRHRVRNRLNKALLELQVIQASLEGDAVEPWEDQLAKVIHHLASLDDELKQGSDCGAELPEDRSIAPPDNRTAERPTRALIVDDNANEATLLSQYLQLNGFATEVVPNGREAITWLRQHDHPDVVLMDMNMPEMDGPTAVHTIREDPSLSHVKLFGVSGLEQADAGVSLGDDGVDQWFTKPVDARKLVDELSRSAPASRLPR